MDDTNKIYTNPELAEFLTNVATAYEIKKKNYFRIVSYQNAAESILTYPKSVHKLWLEDKDILDKIPGIGPNIRRKIEYLFTKHKPHPHNARAFKGIHPAVFTFTKVNGIGPKNAYKLTRKLKFSPDPLEALDELIAYAQNGQIRNLPRFGEKSELQILENTKAFLGQSRRMTLPEAKDTANNLVAYLKEKFSNIEFIPLGSLRRESESVGDIDIAAKSSDAQEILNHFIDYPLNIQTIVKGPKKASIRLKGDIRADIMVQPASTFGSLLQHFTGSRQHNILLRRYAQSLGFSLSEYGIKDLRTGNIHTFESEKDFYNFLKLCYIEPKDRTGEDEIDKARKCYTKNNS